MDWLTKYQSKRAQYWPHVERYFGSLPPPLFRQGVVLRHNLAAAYSDSSQFEDVLCRAADYPLLYMHFWLLDDWRFPEGEARARLEKHLFLAMTFVWAAVCAHESILDPDTTFDRRYLSLERALHQGARRHFAQLFPEASPFWKHYRALMGDYTRAVGKFQERAGKVISFNEEDLLQIGEQLAFAKIPAAAVALQAAFGQVSALPLPRLFSMLDQLNVIFQMRRDISNFRRDLLRGHYTYPIARTMREAGIASDQPVVPERVLGASLLTGSIEKMSLECLARLETCRGLAQELTLPTFYAYLAVVDDAIRELRNLFSLSEKPAVTTGSGVQKSPGPKVFFTPYLDSLSQALEMAEGYLLSDRSFRESWEVQRRGVANLPELIGQAFAPGLIVEVLCQYREDMSEQVNLIFLTLAHNGFRYYPLPDMPPDADDLGLLLRLYPYSAQKEAHGVLLQTPLRWMEANIRESGQIPCWFTSNIHDTPKEPLAILLWGNRCATVEANLLVGLVDYGRATYEAIIERSASHWLDRWLASGLGANALYVSPYALWRALELLAKLSVGPIPESLQRKIGRAHERLFRDLKRETQRGPTTPQEAALLTLACLRPSALSLFDPSWMTLLLKNQRYDGSWAGEPLFVTPTRGEAATWYSSHSVTTAFSYHALKTYMRWKGQWGTPGSGS